MPTQPVVFASRGAAFFWGFAVVYVLMTALMTWMVVIGGAASGHPAWIVYAVMAAFWLAGIPLCRFVARQPCETTTVAPDGTVSVMRRYPLQAAVVRFAPRQVGTAQVVETVDSDGDHHYLAQFDAGADGPYCLAQGGERSVVEAAAARFNDALRH